MAIDVAVPCDRRVHLTVKLLVALLALGSLGSTGPALADLVTVQDIPPSITEDLRFGETLREVRIEGNTYTREWIILRAVKSRIGNPFTQENAQLDVLWIMRLGAFTSVTLTTEPMIDGTALIVTVTERTPYIPSLSIGLTQENGLEVGPAISSSNLLGTSAHLSAYARFGGATNFGLEYADPLLPGRSWMFGYQFNFFHRDRKNELLDFNETTDEFFFEFLQATNDNMRNGVRFRYMAIQSDRDGVTLGSDNFDHVPALGLFVQNDSRNSVYPTDGWYLDLEAAKWGAFGGDANYWRLDLDVRTYTRLPLLGDRHSLAISSYASLINGELGETVPAWSEFFVGGTNSVRGWSLGSRHGQNQWLNTVEYWFRLMDQKRWKFWFIKWRMGLQIGAFGDLGTAWTDSQDLENNLISGGGIGLRLTLPSVTMFRIDVAYGENTLGVRFFVGGGAKATAQKDRVR